MRYFLILLLSVVIINMFCLQNFVIGRCILVKLDQQALASPKLEDDFQEKIACLKEEGIPDECLSFFNTGLGYDKCQEKLNEPQASEVETASKNCIGVSNTERYRGTIDEGADCPQCEYCLVLCATVILCPLGAICNLICGESHPECS